MLQNYSFILNDAFVVVHLLFSVLCDITGSKLCTCHTFKLFVSFLVMLLFLESPLMLLLNLQSFILFEDIVFFPLTYVYPIQRIIQCLYKMSRKLRWQSYFTIRRLL
ncbi:hypothetical protein [Lambdina fiscellaria nucleopolyhedrovirus]|uniref:Uncharacterized protein n=1 Tax=Lambdina fiscellaria nucleopolyhedrovirus TaxID=1642929 RepID=A0A0E3Z8B0_9ABAC|nr:hypothetical protein [Lambdina fiscellaria nucleopolyhedrovirus]AKC91708.1 hypothetical protein [Lambdina fiscellaria nucleopolyhedrovirus]